MSYPKKILAALAVSAMALAAGCGKDTAPDTAVVPNDDGEGIVTATAEAKVTLPKVRTDNGESSPAVLEDSTAAQSADAPENSVQENSGNSAEADSPQEDSSDIEIGASQADVPSPASTTAAPTRTEPAATAQEDVYYLEGTVYENNGKTLLINEADLGKISVSFKSGVKADNIKVGDKVLITYDGYLLESYPAQAKEAYSVKVTEAAEKSCTLQSFTKNDLAFSVLVPEGWSAKEIDYPTEGDFTDWGIRFTPDGQTGGLDIAWHSAFSIREPYDIKPTTVNRNDVDIYSKNGVWRYYVYSNNFIAAASFYGSQDYSGYVPDMEFMLETLTFE
ncbi:MAG: hypothetical protein NC093_02360 [Alistipes sp.]|nr:hypothetical protein [Alistipes sp.]